MKLQKLLVIFLLASVVLAACTPGVLVTPTSLPPTPIIDNSQPPPAVTEAIEALAKRLNVAPGLIMVRAIESVAWPDACLGAANPDEACAEMIVNGYRAVLEVSGKTYEAHTNQDGSVVRFVEDGAKGPLGEDPVVVDTPAAAAAAAAAQALASALGISLDKIAVIQAEAVDWPDSCLGVQKPEETCLAAITPGYRVILDVDGQAYQVNTNTDGSAYRVLETPEEAPQAGPGNEKDAVDTAKNLLTQQLGVTVDKIRLLSAEAVDWPNGCLGIEMPGRMCTQVITPGFRVVLEHAGKTYAFHTDQAGGVVYPAIAPLPQTAGKVIVWQETAGNVCSRVEIGSKGAAFGKCGEPLQEAALESQRANELAYFYSAYSSFTSATKAGTVAFEGQGEQLPVEAEMRSIAEWARLVMMEAQAGRSSAAWGAALSWHREGGIAGFCNDLVIYLTGWAAPSSCRPAQERAFNTFRLSTDELTQLYAWVDRYERFELVQKDDAVADSMTVRLIFEGLGAEKATPEQQAELAMFAGEMYAVAIE